MGRGGFRSGSLGCLSKARLQVNSSQVIVAGWQIGMMQGVLSGCGSVGRGEGGMIEGWRVREDKCLCFFFSFSNTGSREKN